MRIVRLLSNPVSFSPESLPTPKYDINTIVLLDVAPSAGGTST